MELGIHHTFIVPIAGVTLSVPFGRIVARPIDVMRWGAVVLTVLGAQPTFRMYHRPLPGSTTGQTIIGDIAVTAAGIQPGMVSFFDLPTARPRFNPGTEVVIETIVSGVSGSVSLFVVYQHRGMHKRDKSTAYFAKLVDAAPANGV
jgi:hypothetical protein